MGGPRRPIEVRQMKKPKWKVGDEVIMRFLGSKQKVRLTELKSNPQHIERWIYSAIALKDGFKYSYIGIDGSENFNNIHTEDNSEASKD